MSDYSCIVRKVWPGSAAAAAAVLLGLGSAASAAVVGNTTGEFSATGSDTEFDPQASAVDLIDTDQPTLTSTAVAPPPENGCCGYTLEGMHDGSAAANANRAFWNGVTSPRVVTYTLNTALNPLGYDITQITNIQGHSNARGVYANQEWSVSYSTVNDPATFVPLTSVDYQPYGEADPEAGSTIVRVTDDTGVLASGVAALQFTLPVASGDQTAVYRETDVFGRATVPEPATALLAAGGLGCIGMLARRRRRPLAA